MPTRAAHGYHSSVHPLLLASVAGLALPAGEPAEAWSDALALAGLRPCTAACEVTARAEGAGWVLRVAGSAGEVRVATPTTPRGREDVALLAASLLRPGPAVALPGVPGRDGGSSASWGEGAGPPATPPHVPVGADPARGPAATGTSTPGAPVDDAARPASQPVASRPRVPPSPSAAPPSGAGVPPTEPASAPPSGAATVGARAVPAPQLPAEPALTAEPEPTPQPEPEPAADSASAPAPALAADSTSSREPEPESAPEPELQFESELTAEPEPTPQPELEPAPAADSASAPAPALAADSTSSREPEPELAPSPLRSAASAGLTVSGRAGVPPAPGATLSGAVRLAAPGPTLDLVLTLGGTLPTEPDVGVGTLTTARAALAVELRGEGPVGPFLALGPGVTTFLFDAGTLQVGVTPGLAARVGAGWALSGHTRLEVAGEGGADLRRVVLARGDEVVGTVGSSWAGAALSLRFE